MVRKLTSDEYRGMLHSIMLDGVKDEWTAAELSLPLQMEAGKVNQSNTIRQGYGYYYNWDDCSDWGQRVAQVLRDDPGVHRVKKTVDASSRWYTGKKRVYVYSIDRNNIEWWIRKGLGTKLLYRCGCQYVFSTKTDKPKIINFYMCPIHSLE